MKRLTMIATLCVAACTPGRDEPAADQAEQPAAAEKPAEVPSLAGEWSVTALGGQPLQQVFPMTATITPDTMTVRSECVTLVWSYTQDRNIVAFKPVSSKNCARNQTTNENEMERAMKGATIALFSGEGKEVQLSGNGGTASLTRR